MARSWAIGTASTCARARHRSTWRAKRLESGRGGALADPDGHDSGREQQHVAALDVLEVGAVEALDAGEAGVVLVDEVGQLRLAHPRRHRQAGDGDPAREPHRGVTGEQQVGQRVDEEVVRPQQAGDDAAVLDLIVAQPGSDDGGEVGRCEVGHRIGEVVAQAITEVQGRVGALDDLLARLGILEGLDEQLDEVEHLDAVVAQRLGEGVVLVLGAADPRDAVEQQRVVVAWRESSQLGAGTVQHHRPEPADLAVRAQWHAATVKGGQAADLGRTGRQAAASAVCSPATRPASPDLRYLRCH